MVVIADYRGTGRTTKLAALAADDPECFLVVLNGAVADYLISKSYAMGKPVYSLIPQDPKNIRRVMTVQQVKNGRNRGQLWGKRCYVDDLDRISPKDLAEIAASAQIIGYSVELMPEFPPLTP